MVTRFKKTKRAVVKHIEPITEALPTQNKAIMVVLGIVLLVSGIYLVMESSTKLQTNVIYQVRVPLIGEVLGIKLDQVEFLDVKWEAKLVNKPYGIIEDLIGGGIKELTKSDFKVKIRAMKDNQEVASTTRVIRATAFEVYVGEISVEVPEDMQCTYILEVYSIDNKLLDSETR